ncbi:hypothetical protein ACH5RR_022384 [Cinchona calisaya]|uniref:Terpene synthase N-terminal domain-containing protein n=1 Tax=Cinchona calisaya TaxID=153742 RepID=A0ABD2ZAU5_9GENT
MNEDGEFDESLCDDMKGMLNLYEACFLSLEGEINLDLAREFTTKHLKNYLDNKQNIDDDQNLMSSLVYHALELPLWWRFPRIEAIWYIDAYERSSNMNPIMLELAKLDLTLFKQLISRT